jgi:hypothetical protein
MLVGRSCVPTDGEICPVVDVLCSEQYFPSVQILLDLNDGVAFHSAPKEVAVAALQPQHGSANA